MQFTIHFIVYPDVVIRDAHKIVVNGPKSIDVVRKDSDDLQIDFGAFIRKVTDSEGRIVWDIPPY
jgi:hypothetical protein